MELTDNDYNNLCDICKNTPLFKQNKKNRVLIKYRGTHMWCVMSKKSKIIKTIYPIRKADLRRYLSVLGNKN